MGAPPRFTKWRRGQDLSLSHLIEERCRFPVECVPTGVGKTLIYITNALLTGKRTAALTSTKGLQDQLEREFPGSVVDIRGKGNYPCIGYQDIFKGYKHLLLKTGRRFEGGLPSCEEGPCFSGEQCLYKAGACHYFTSYRAALRAQIVSTNYSYWLSIHAWGGGLGNFDALALDEAHNSPAELSAHLRIELSDWEVDKILESSFPRSNSLEEWCRWAQQRLTWIELRQADLRADPRRYRERRTLAKVKAKIEYLSFIRGEWVKMKTRDGIAWQALWPGPYAESRLFLEIPQVALFSATVREKTCDLLQIPSKDRLFHEYDSPFPARRRPVYMIPTTRVDWKWTEAHKTEWVIGIDRFIKRRLDRKGIIHTVSYDRAKLLLERSDFREVMWSHTTRTTAEVVERFKAAAPPAILVSPSVMTGWNFPYEECEFQIVGKLPFPNSSDPVTKARQKDDGDYGPFLCMTNLVQMVGRGMRATDDACETGIFDDHARWFIPKYEHFAPRWFMEAIVWVDSSPKPPPKLERKEG